MSRPRRKFDREFRDGAVRIVKETGQPVAEVARALRVPESTFYKHLDRPLTGR